MPARKRITTEEFIARAIKVHGDKYGYDESIYLGLREGVRIQCRTCGSVFTQAAGNHLAGSGCPTCVFREANRIRLRKTWEKWLLQVHKLFGDKFSYHLSVYKGNAAKIIIVCNVCGVEFEKRPHEHLRSGKCFVCDKTYSGGKSWQTTELFIERAKKVHGDKYDYSLAAFTTGGDKLQLKCQSCQHIWWQKADNHLQGRGCPNCAHLNHRTAHDDFVKRAKNIHGDDFDYSHDSYRGTERKFKLFCKKGQHFFYQTPHSHLGGRKCLECENSSRCKSFAQFVLDARKIHGERYEYFEDDYYNTATKILIGCRTCGLQYRSTPHTHLNDRGCPKCGALAFISKAEKAWLDSLSIPQEHRQHTIIIGGERFLVDAYNPDTNTIYEFNGDYWHGNPHKFPSDGLNKRNGKTFGQLYQDTLDRENLLKQAGYNLITMWEYDWKKAQKAPKSKKKTA